MPTDPRGSAASKLTVEGDFSIKIPCSAPAPLVVNGALFVGCQLDKDHDGPHKVEITWGLRDDA